MVFVDICHGLELGWSGAQMSWTTLTSKFRGRIRKGSRIDNLCLPEHVEHLSTASLVGTAVQDHARLRVSAVECGGRKKTACLPYVGSLV